MKSLPTLVVALVAVASCKPPAAASDDDAAAKPLVQVKSAKVERGDVSDMLSVTGSISPLPDHEAKIAAQTAGKIASVLVKTGSYMNKGDTLATLAPGTTPGQIQEAQAAVRLARETLAQARLNLAAQIQTQKTTVNQAELNLQAEEVALAKLRAGSRPQEIAQAAAAVSGAQATLTATRQALRRAQALADEGLLARKDLEAAQEQERTSAAALTTAQQSFSLARQGNRPEDIRAGEVAVAQAAEALRAARALSIQNRAKWQDVQIAKAQLASAEGALHMMQAQARFLTVTAPVSGVVVGRTVNAGENVDVTTVIASIVDLDTVRLILNVPADRTAEVKIGQRVLFTTDANPSAEHEATVTVVSRAVDPVTNSVQVEATARNTEKSLRDDGFVKARIVLRTDRDVLTVPAAAVVDKDGKSAVFVVGPDKTVKGSEVEIGIKTPERIEIVSGINFGDQVVTTGAYELDDGTAVELTK